MKIEKVLKENNYRFTKEREDLFNFFKKKEFFSYNDIFKKFKDISRSSVFRTINLFLDLWIIRKIFIWETSICYEFVDKKNHNEYLLCEKCNSIIAMKSKKICKKLEEEVEKIWFKMKNHNIWITGICNECL